jgi:hypothetical protein
VGVQEIFLALLDFREFTTTLWHTRTETPLNLEWRTSIGYLPRLRTPSMCLNRPTSHQQFHQALRAPAKLGPSRQRLLRRGNATHSRTLSSSATATVRRGLRRRRSQFLPAGHSQILPMLEHNLLHHLLLSQSLLQGDIVMLSRLSMLWHLD